LDQSEWVVVTFCSSLCSYFERENLFESQFVKRGRCYFE